MRMAVSKFAEWEALPELACPVVEGDQVGEVCTVLKVGFLALPADQCSPSERTRAVRAYGKYVLPTIEIEVREKKKLYRLRRGLCQWALDQVALVQYVGRNPFPRRVEFGIREGHYYADVL
jgi:hypothetical protein